MRCAQAQYQADTCNPWFGEPLAGRLGVVRCVGDAPVGFVAFLQSIYSHLSSALTAVTDYAATWIVVRLSHALDGERHGTVEGAFDLFVAG